jgi:ribA/ribD-fused uncharacterized protein
MTDTSIRGFSGAYTFLSNFYPIGIEIDGIFYKSSEHYYMSQKTDDVKIRQKIIDAPTPGVAKRLGAKLKLRPDWEEKYKNKTMLVALFAKFSDPYLKQKLKDTGDGYLEETNHWGDVYWGVCDDVGKNMLGRMLMYVRSVL